MTDHYRVAAERRFCIECRRSRRVGDRRLECHRNQVTAYSELTGEWLPAFGDLIPLGSSNPDKPCGPDAPAWEPDPAMVQP